MHKKMDLEKAGHPSCLGFINVAAYSQANMSMYGVGGGAYAAMWSADAETL